MIRHIAFIFVGIAFFVVGCSRPNTPDPQLDAEMPPKILWAWERPEDVTFADPGEFGVAFLSQTLYLSGRDVIRRSRRLPLEVAPGAYIVALTRVETTEETFKRPSFDSES